MDKPGQLAARLAARLLRRARRYWRGLLLVFAATLVIAAGRTFPALVVKPFIDDLPRSSDLGMLYNILLLLVVILLAVAGAMYLRMTKTEWIVNRFTIEMRNDVAAHLLRVPLRFYHRERAGDVVSRVTNDISHMHLVTDFLFNDILMQPLHLAAAIGVVIYANPLLGLGTLILLPLYGYPLYRLGSKLRKKRYRSMQKLGDATHTLTEIIGGAKTIKANQAEDLKLQQFEEDCDGVFVYIMKAVRRKALSEALVQVATAFGLAILVGGAGYFLTTGKMTAGEFAMFFIGIVLTRDPVRNIARAYNKLQESLAGAQRVFTLLDEHPEPPDAPGAVALDGVRSGIEYRGVEFAYDTVPVLRGIDLKIAPGETVAFVGPTGAGKTTLLDLLLRLYEPFAGEIIVDGHPIGMIQRRSLRERMAVVTQDTFLFNDTIGNNIRTGAPDATQEAVEEVARKALIHDFIVGLPEGYETTVGDRGSKLSGGERQRISIARALLRRPKILILDEPTSALDAETERDISAALKNLLHVDDPDRITLVIAHRLSTVRDATRIIVLKQGRIVEVGTHEELVAAGGLYTSLYEAQFGIRTGS